MRKRLLAVFTIFALLGTCAPVYAGQYESVSSGCRFALPEAWRDVTTVNTFDNGANVMYGGAGAVLTLQAGSDPYWLSYEPEAAFDLEGGGMCGKGWEEWVKVSDGGPCIKARIRLG